MNFEQYQVLSQRTAKRHENELINYGLGIAGEAGEVADLIKKAMFHGHDIKQHEIEKELGDVLWYLSQIASLAGLELAEVAEANIEKLKRRYPDGFTSQDSKRRVDVDGSPIQTPE